MESFDEEKKAEAVAAPISVTVPRHISQPDRPDPPSGDSGFSAPGGGGYGPWKADGGLIRKKYGNGGIVDLR